MARKRFAQKSPAPVDRANFQATALADAGDLRLACHLADFALEAAPAEPSVREAVAAIHEACAGSETSLMAVNPQRSAAAYAGEGRAYA